LPLTFRGAYFSWKKYFGPSGSLAWLSTPKLLEIEGEFDILD
jgi:hypothetical protein